MDFRYQLHFGMIENFTAGAILCFRILLRNTAILLLVILRS